MPARVALPLLSLLATALALAVCLGALEGMPHVSDEVSYTLQARLFAAGMRVGPAGDNPSMLSYLFWQTSPASFSPFPPGWPALLAMGERLGVPWLVNPLLVAALPPLTWLLAREWCRDEALPLLAAFVAALSPGVWVLAASRMAHSSVLVALLAAAVVVLRRRDPPWAWAGAGLAVGYVVLARHYDAFLLGGPLLAWSLLRAPRGRERALLLLFPALASAVVLWDNWQLTGHALRFPINAWYDGWVADAGRQGCNALGFGADRGCHPTFGDWGHTPWKALRLVGEAALRLDRFLLGLPGGLVLAGLGAWRLRRPEPLLLLVLVVLGHALYWSPARDYGARLWHPLYIVLPLCVAAGARWLLKRWALPALMLVAALGSVPLAGALSDRFWCLDGGLARSLDRAGIRHGVVFMRGLGARRASWPALGVDSFVCDPMLEAGDGFWLQDPVRPAGGLQLRHALSSDEEVRRYMARYHPGEPAWLAVHDIAADTRRIAPVDLSVVEEP